MNNYDKNIADDFDFEYLGTSDRDTLMWVRIGDSVYVYDRAPGAPPIRDVDKSVRGMMKHGSRGGAFGFIRKYANLRHKMPASKAGVKEDAASLIDRIARGIIHDSTV